MKIACKVEHLTDSVSNEPGSPLQSNLDFFQAQ